MIVRNGEWKEEWGPKPELMTIFVHRNGVKKGKPFTIILPTCYMCIDIMGLKSPQGNCTMVDEHNRYWCDSCVKVDV